MTVTVWDPRDEDGYVNPRDVLDSEELGEYYRAHPSLARARARAERKGAQEAADREFVRRMQQHEREHHGEGDDV
jgi:hypothetical protein